MTSPGAFIKPTSASIPMKAFRARSASTSEVRSGVRSLSVERSGIPRSSASIEVFDFANVITSTSGSNLNFHARSASTLSIGSSDPLSHSFPGSSGNLLSPRPAFLMQDKAFSGSESLANRLSKTLGGMHLNVEERKKLAMSNMLTYELVLKMEFYSKFTPTSVSMSQFFDHGDCGNGVEKSFIFLRREIPVRLANIMMELELLPPELLAQPACMDILHQYSQSFAEVLKFESAESNAETHEEFNKLLSSIRHRHQDTVVHMADALHILKDEGILHVNSKDKLNQAIQYFLDRLYMSRISINMLISHNKALYCPEESKNRSDGLKGTIDPKCDAVKIAMSAYQNAVFWCGEVVRG